MHSSSSQQTADPNTLVDGVAVFINDADNITLGRLIDQLGSLEDGALAHSEQSNSRRYNVQLKTKYYDAEVPVLSFPSFEAFAEAIKETKSKDKEDLIGRICSLMVCASRTELTNDFLARITQLSTKLTSVEAKALILKDPIELRALDDADQITHDPNVVSDAILSKFAVFKNVELISIVDPKKMRRNSEDEEDGAGTTGIARVVEVLETIRWPQLRLKPNPIGRREHNQRIRDYIEMETDQAEERERQGQRHKAEKGTTEEKSGKEKKARDKPAGSASKGGNGAGEANGNRKKGEEGQREEKRPDDDYPDSTDEEAILDWFHKPFSVEKLSAQ